MLFLTAQAHAAFKSAMLRCLLLMSWYERTPLPDHVTLSFKQLEPIAEEPAHAGCSTRLHGGACITTQT
eukprot:1151675-Pelagomonas_calceolata.AAC.1